MCPEDSERYTSASPPPARAPAQRDREDSVRRRRTSAAGNPGAREGEKARFDDLDEAGLVERFRDRLRLFAVQRLSDATQAEDVAQEVLRRVLEALREDRLRNPEALTAYVFQTARHVCAHRERNAGRTRRVLRRLTKDRRGDTGSADPLAELVDSERRARVRAALAELSDSDRRLLRMLFYEESESREAARELEITPGALRVRKHRALKRLSKILERGARDLKRSGSDGHP